MKIEDICVSKELAVELKEEGYNQDSFFSYVHGNLLCGNDDRNNIGYSAPIASEIAEKLPALIYIEPYCRKPYYLVIKKIICNNKDEYQIYYRDLPYTRELKKQKRTTIPAIDDIKLYEINDENFCNAFAKMWLYLKKENLLEVDKCTN